jgi:hypothetical protein
MVEKGMRSWVLFISYVYTLVFMALAMKGSIYRIYFVNLIIKGRRT